MPPTDFELLEALANGKRNTAANLAAELDKNRGYINTRLPDLVDYGLLEKVGPHPDSGLYVITERGQIALELRDEYEYNSNFEEKINSRLS